jgi:hypothetical protein
VWRRRTNRETCPSCRPSFHRRASTPSHGCGFVPWCGFIGIGRLTAWDSLGPGTRPGHRNAARLFMQHCHDGTLRQSSPRHCPNTSPQAVVCAATMAASAATSLLGKRRSHVVRARGGGAPIAKQSRPAGSRECKQCQGCGKVRDSCLQRKSGPHRLIQCSLFGGRSGKRRLFLLA